MRRKNNLKGKLVKGDKNSRKMQVFFIVRLLDRQVPLAALQNGG